MIMMGKSIRQIWVKYLKTGDLSAATILLGIEYVADDGCKEDL